MLGPIFAYLMLIRWWRKERDIYQTEWKVKYADIDFSSATENSTQETGKLKEETVVVNRLRKKLVSEDRGLVKEMATIMALKHVNLTAFMGASTDPGKVCSLWLHCSNGTLDEVLKSPKLKAESKQFSIAMDLCLGLNYLHTSDLGYHGRLKSTNCLLDDQWVLKLSDFGIAKLRKGEDQSGNLESEIFCQSLFWTAPERLRCILEKHPQKLTKESDIFSLGVVLKQILCDPTTYTDSQECPKDILMKIAYPKEEQTWTRPDFDCNQRHKRRAIKSDLHHLIQSCWAEDPDDRPKVKDVFKKLRRLRPRKKSRAYNKMRGAMERYAQQVEQVLFEKICPTSGETKANRNESKMSLTREIRDQSEKAQVYSDVTICFSNLVNFPAIVYQSSPLEIVEMLDRLECYYADVIKGSNAYVIETIGDALMLASGCPVSDDQHATAAAAVALTLLNCIDQFVIPHLPTERLGLRMGLHSGPVAAGFVGKTVQHFCLFGNTVEMASRMESLSQPDRILISESTFRLLKTKNKFATELKGTTEIKGKDGIQTYWLNGWKE